MGSNGSAPRSLTQTIEAGHRLGEDLARAEETVERLRADRVEIIRDLVEAGISLASIAEIFGISKQRAFSLLHPAGKKLDSVTPP